MKGRDIKEQILIDALCDILNPLDSLNRLAVKQGKEVNHKLAEDITYLQNIANEALEIHEMLSGPVAHYGDEHQLNIRDDLLQPLESEFVGKTQKVYNSFKTTKLYKSSALNIKTLYDKFVAMEYDTELLAWIIGLIMLSVSGWFLFPF